MTLSVVVIPVNYGSAPGNKEMRPFPAPRSAVHLRAAWFGPVDALKDFREEAGSRHPTPLMVPDQQQWHETAGQHNPGRRIR